MHIQENLESRIDKDDLKDVLQGLEHLIKRYKVQGIIMHTKDYSMYYGRQDSMVSTLKRHLPLEIFFQEPGARVGDIMAVWKSAARV